MKFFALALSASTAQAVAVAEAAANRSPKGWCLTVGESCWKVKRAAEAFSTSIASSGPYTQSRVAELSNHRGGAAYNAKRSVDELAALVASTQSSPATLYRSLAMAEHFAPDSNLSETRSTTAAVVARNEQPAKRWCLFTGEGCWNRELAPWCDFARKGCWRRSVRMEASEAEAHPWCLVMGERCWERAAEEHEGADDAFCPFEEGPCFATRADFAQADKWSCERPGEACHKARRAAEALITAIESAPPAKNDVDIEARWCMFTGEGCWKRDGMDDVVARCNAPDGACTAARRDLAAMQAAARSLIDSLEAN